MLDRIKEFREFVGSVPPEMKRVTWPDWDQLRNATAVIIVFVLIVAGIIGGMDLVFRQVLGFVVRTLGG
ncbi:MAG: preprotein translocase subunit SecE [Gemmatimonadota bacterium]|nr:MAG: preprotein translocase subunit SecE [Gemmatimonadota bacterium]